MSVLLLLAPESEALTNVELQSLVTAKSLAETVKDDLVVGVIGANSSGFISSNPHLGADRVVVVEHPLLGASRYATDVKAFRAIVAKVDANIVLAPSQLRFKRAFPAATVGYSLDSQVSNISVKDSIVTFERWFYRQRIFGKMERPLSKVAFLLAVTSEVCDANFSECVNIEKLEIDFSEQLTSVIGVEDANSDKRTVKPDAKLLFVAGAGWTKKQADAANDTKMATNLISDFLDLSQASLGSSKSLVDQGAEGDSVLPFLSHLNQVGQTGSTPRHQKGLATCCHGEEPHVVGWRFISERRAVNKDANCGWAHGKADVLYVADAFEVMKELNKLL